MENGIEKRATRRHHGFVRDENPAPRKIQGPPEQLRDCETDPQYLLLLKFLQQTSWHRRFQSHGVVRPRPGKPGICKARRTRMPRAPLLSLEPPRRVAPSLRAARFPAGLSADAGSARHLRVA